MSWIDDNKNAGPWPFEEQPDVWGYLNNPLWSNHPKGAADSISASEFCEGKGIALDPEHTHKPCGHWHKKKEGYSYYIYDKRQYHNCVQAIDIYSGNTDNGESFVFMMMATDDYGGDEYKTTIYSYDSLGRAWVDNTGFVDVGENVYMSMVHIDPDIYYVPYIMPKIVSDDYFICIGTFYGGDGGSFLWKTVKGTTSKTEIFQSDEVNACLEDVVNYFISYYGIQLVGGYTSSLYPEVANSPCYVDNSGNVVLMFWGSLSMKFTIPPNPTVYTTTTPIIVCGTSHDYGQTFTYKLVAHYLRIEFYMYIGTSNIVKDSNDNLWCAVSYRHAGVDADCYIDVLKSTDYGDSWSSVNTISQTAGEFRSAKIYVDGNDIYVARDNSSYSAKLYRSTDGGGNFNLIQTLSNATICAVYAEGGTFMLMKRTTSAVNELYRSTDKGSNLNLVHTMAAPDYYDDYFSNAVLKKQNELWLATYHELYSGEMFMYSYSDDNGLTWQDQTYKHSDEEWQEIRVYPGGPNLYDDEPQVWPM